MVKTDWIVLALLAPTGNSSKVFGRTKTDTGSLVENTKA